MADLSESLLWYTPAPWVTPEEGPHREPGDRTQVDNPQQFSAVESTNIVRITCLSSGFLRLWRSGGQMRSAGASSGRSAIRRAFERTGAALAVDGSNWADIKPERVTVPVVIAPPGYVGVSNSD